MKKLALCLGLTVFSSHLFACVNKAPMSTVLAAISNNGAGKDAIMDCSKLPSDECVCFDEVTEWPAGVIVDAIGDGDPIYDQSCEAGDPACISKIIGYQQVVIGKKVVNDPVRLAAIQAKLKADADALSAKQSKRAAALAALKATDLSTATTISALKVVIKNLMDANLD